jgi:1,4-alpha-glucan branching enzyme
MNRLLLILIAVLGMSQSQAQLLTWTPPFPSESNPAQTLVITMDATKGNRGLMNFATTSDVYVHIGVITNLSSSANWSYVPFTWGSTNAAARATYIGNNKWTFTINGSLRTFFGITNPAEQITWIGILFRSGNGNTAQRNDDGSDMFIPVYSSALAVRLTDPPSMPKRIRQAEPQSMDIGTSFPVTANTNNPSTITLYHNSVVIGTGSNIQTLTAQSAITALGNQQIVAVANDGTTTRSDTLNVLVTSPSSPVAALPAGVRDGINYISNSSVTLVLRAPGKNVAVVTGEFNNWTPGIQHIMNKTPDGKFFWVTLTGLTAGTEYAYQYIVDGSLKIADPYAEKILDPWNDVFIPASTYPNLKPYPAGQSGIVSVLKIDQTTYNWAVPNFSRPDKRGLVIYELLVRDFVNAKNWKTIQDSLNYLKKLGINAIELMPFNEFEGNESWGYNPSFYFATDKYYGTRNAFKEFVDSCHRKGIAVIMDIALNHSFGQSPMVQLYWDAANNRPAANNPWFNPVAKHPFNVGYDMNHESSDTKYYFSRVVEHWLKEYKIDGFRFDLSKGFTQVNSCTTPGCSSNSEVNNWSNYDASRIALWKGYYDTLMLKSSGSYVILEHFAANNEERELSDYGMLLWGNMHFQFANAAKGDNSGWDFSGALHTVRGWNNPFLISYMESHDEERMMYDMINYGNSVSGYNIRDTTTALKRKEMNAAFLFSMPGPKMLWQFGELGYPYSINTCVNGTVSNDCRLAPKPIRWDYLNDPRRKKVYDVYSKIINLRSHPWYRQAFLSGNTSQSLNQGFKWLRLSSGDSSHLVVIGNFDLSSQTQAITFPSAGTWYELFTNETFSATGGTQGITLVPGEYRLYVNRNVNNVSTTPIVNIPSQSELLKAKVFPNPTAGAFTVDIQLPVSGNVNIELFNQLGQFVRTLHNGFLQRGNQQLRLNAVQVPGGNYFIKINTRTALQTIPVTIQ